MIKLEVLVMHLTHVGLRILFIHEWKGIKIFDPILIKLVYWSAFFRLFQVIQNEVKFWLLLLLYFELLVCLINLLY